MYDNSQYERLKARHDEAYSRKQQAYREQQTAWQNYQSIRDATSRAFETMQSARAEMEQSWTQLQSVRERNDCSWSEYKQTLSRNNAQIDRLKDAADQAHCNMREAFDSASRAYDSHDGAAAKSYAEDGHSYQAERDRLNAEVRALIEENKTARFSAGAYDSEVQQAKEIHARAHDRFIAARTEFRRLKDRQDQAKTEQKRAANNFHEAKNNFQQAKDDLDAFKAKQHEDKRIHQQDKEALAAKAGIPRQYWKDLVIRKGKNGSINIYFGGSGSGDGTGHGHVSLNSSGAVTYTRMPFEPHGAQNFTDYIDSQDYGGSSLGSSPIKEHDRNDGSGKTDWYYGGSNPEGDGAGHGHVIIRDDQVIYWREPGQPKDKWLINEDADIPGKNGECRFKGGHTHI